MKQANLINLQFAIFFSKKVNDPSKYFSDLNNDLGNIFDRTPFIMPVPDENGLENVPIVQLYSSSGYQCSLSRLRADLIFNDDLQVGYEEIKGDYFDKIRSLITFFANRVSIFQVNRIGFVLRYFVQEELQGKIAKDLLKKEFVNLIGNDPTELNLTYGAKKTIGSFDSNDHIIISGCLNGVGQKGLMIIRDFNTSFEENKLSEYQGKFNADNVQEFVNSAEQNINLDNITKMIWEKQN